jgi:hypothetical protein
MVDSYKDKGGLMEAFNAVKVKLSDYDILTTLGTGITIFLLNINQKNKDPLDVSDWLVIKRQTSI